MVDARTKHVFAGGDYDHRASSGQEARGGLFRMNADGGDWQALTQGLPPNVEARAFAVHPFDRRLLFVGTQEGPYRSADGGDHWERLDLPDRGAPIYAVSCHPMRPEVVYAGAEGDRSAVYRSQDGGDSWQRLPEAAPPGHCRMSFPPRVICITADPSRPDDLYVAFEIGGVIRSSDGGETFTDVSASLIRLAEQPALKNRSESDTDAEGLLDSHAIVISRAMPGTPLLGNRMGLFRGDERGTAWSDMQLGRFSPLTYCRGVAVSPHAPRTLYATLSPAARSSDGALYRSDDFGESWRRFDHGVRVEATMVSVAPDPDDPARVYCASRSGQIFVTADDGRSWRETRLPANVMQRVRFVACN